MVSASDPLDRLVYAGRALLCTAAIAMSAAAAFWIPCIVTRWFSAGDMSIGMVALVTVLAPASTVFWFLCRKDLLVTTGPKHSVVLAVACVLGVWILGPLCMTAMQTSSGGGFQLPGALGRVVSLTVGFPIAVPIMSVYEGTVLAVGVVSAMLVVCSVVDGLPRKR